MQAADLHASFERQRKQMEDRHNMQMDRLAETLRAKEAEVDDVRSAQEQYLAGKLEETERAMKGRTAKMTVLLTEHDRLTRSEGELRKRNLELEEDVDNLEAQVAQLRSASADVDQLRDRVRKLESRTSELERELDDERMKCQRLNSEVLRTEQLLHDSERKQDKIRKDTSSAYDKQARLIDDKMAVIQELEDRIRAAERDAEAARAEHERALADLESSRTDGGARLAAMQAEHERQVVQLEAKLEIAKQEKADALGEMTRNHEAALQALRDEHAREMAKARSEMSTVGQSEQITKSRLQQLERDLVHARTSFDDLQAHYNANSTALRTIERDLDQARLERDAALATVAERDAQLAASQETIGEREQELARSRAQLQALSAERSSVGDSAERMRSKMAHLQAGLTALRGQARHLRTELDETRRDVAVPGSADVDQTARIRAAIEAVVAHREAANARAMDKLRGELAESEKRLAAREASVVEAEAATRQQRDALAAQQRELRSAVAKVANVDTSMEAALTCHGCMSVFVNPQTLVPCMHTLCEACASAAKAEHDGKPFCSECFEPAERIVDNDPLDTLASKFTYRQQALAALQAMVAEA